MMAALELAKHFHRLGLPWIIENPKASKMWWVPPMRRLAASKGVCEITCDFCQYGKPWRKRTTFLCGNVPADTLHRINRTCQGKHGICSATHNRHFQLTGSSPEGISWTRIAQPYPTKLCYGLAHALTFRTKAMIYKV